MAEPREGDVIRYAYMWCDDVAKGRDHGKTRPCMVVRTGRDDSGKLHVEVAPITRSADLDPQTRAKRSVEIPAKDTRAMGLSDDVSRVVTGETNRFRWPSYDAGKVQGRASQDVQDKTREQNRQHVQEKTFRRLNREEYDKLLERERQRDKDRER